MTEHKQIGSVLRTNSSHNGQISTAAARCLPDIGRNPPGIRPLFSLQPAVEWVQTKGPVVLGTDWYDSFDHPDSQGVVQIKPRARIEGGHCYLWRGVDTAKAMAHCVNSWGDNWGASGDFYIPFRDLEKLILNEGEVCSAIEKKLTALEVT